LDRKVAACKALEKKAEWAKGIVDRIDAEIVAIFGNPEIRAPSWRRLITSDPLLPAARERVRRLHGKRVEVAAILDEYDQHVRDRDIARTSEERSGEWRAKLQNAIAKAAHTGRGRSATTTQTRKGRSASRRGRDKRRTISPSAKSITLQLAKSPLCPYCGLSLGPDPH
jgi:hypothetical protein